MSWTLVWQCDATCGQVYAGNCSDAFTVPWLVDLNQVYFKEMYTAVVHVFRMDIETLRLTKYYWHSVKIAERHCYYSVKIVPISGCSVSFLALNWQHIGDSIIR